MSKATFRTMVTVLLAAVGVALYRIYYITPNLPVMAIQYIEWWRTQPMTVLQLFLLEHSYIVHAALVLSLFALLFFWSLARHVFVFSIMIAMLSEVGASAPLVVPGSAVALDNLISVLSGMVIVGMYAKPLRDNFSSNPFRANSNSRLKDHAP